MSQKKCSKCSKNFECTNETARCWCESLEIELATLNQLKKEFDNCLCKSCLEEYSKTSILEKK